MLDNGRQFDNKKVRDLCEELLFPHHPQTNGQVEVVNKTIKNVLKVKLDASKRAWLYKLSMYYGQSIPLVEL